MKKSGMYLVKYHQNVFDKDLPILSPPVRAVLQKAIEEKLLIHPLEFGKPLRYSLSGHRALRVGDYRIIYRIESNIVLIITVQHRKSVYKT